MMKRINEMPDWYDTRRREIGVSLYDAFDVDVSPSSVFEDSRLYYGRALTSVHTMLRMDTMLIYRILFLEVRDTRELYLNYINHGYRFVLEG